MQTFTHKQFQSTITTVSVKEQAKYNISTILFIRQQMVTKSNMQKPQDM